MPFFARQKVILAKIEATYGVDPTPTGALNAILMQNVRINPMDGQDVSRDLDLPYFGAQQQFPTGMRVTLSGETELIGATALGTAPAWGVLARSCGMAQVLNAGVSVVYNPVSTGFESITLYFDYAGTRQVITGCRGTAKIVSNSQGIPKIQWDFTGRFAAPTDTAAAVPTLTSWQTPQIANKTNTPTFTINGFAAYLRDFELDLANDVVMRLMQNYEEVVITDSKAAIKAQIEAVALASLNPFSLANNQTSFGLNFVHGVGAGKVVTIAAPNCRLNRMSGYAEQDKIVEWPLAIMPLPTAGNDQFTITLT